MRNKKPRHKRGYKKSQFAFSCFVIRMYEVTNELTIFLSLGRIYVASLNLRS